MRGRKAFVGQLGAACLGLLFLFSCSRFGEQPPDVYKAFSDSLRAKDSVALQSCVATTSLLYFDRMREWIVRGEAEGIRQLKPFDRHTILFARILKDDWSEQQWIAYAESIEALPEGAFDEISMDLIRYHLADLRIGHVQYHDGIAGGLLYANDNLYPTRIRFVQDNGWKIDVIGFLQDRFDYDQKPFMSDDYRNLDTVEEMLGEGFGERYTWQVYEARL